MTTKSRAFMCSTAAFITLICCASRLYLAEDACAQAPLSAPGLSAEQVLKDGRKLLDQRQYDAALSRFQQYCSIRPSSAIGHFWVGITFDEMANYGKSEQAYRDGIAVAERNGMDSAELRTNLGNALFKQNRVDEAIESYDKAININPMYALAHLNLARAEIEKGKGEFALHALQRCEELRYKGPHLSYYKAKALVLLGRKEEAAVVIKRLLQEIPEGVFKQDLLKEFGSIL